MTTAAPTRPFVRPLRLDLPRFESAPAPPSSVERIETRSTAELRCIEPAAAPDPAPVPTPHPVQPVIAAAPVAIAERILPANAPPVVATPSVTRRDGTIGLAVGILVLTIVLAAALAMQRSMHGWPPGMH